MYNELPGHLSILLSYTLRWLLHFVVMDVAEVLNNSGLESSPGAEDPGKGGSFSCIAELIVVVAGTFFWVLKAFDPLGLDCI